MSVIDDLFSGREAASLPAPSANPAPKGTDPHMQECQASLKTSKTDEKLNEDLQYCLSKMTQVEDILNLKDMRYEEFIRDLLKEKQRTEKNYLEFKRVEGEVIKLKNWGYAVTAVTSLAVIRVFF